MAGHLGMPANCARAVEDKCKFERRGFGHFRSHNSCRSAFLAGEVFCFSFAGPRRKSKSLVQGRTTAWLQTQTHTSRVRKERDHCIRQSPAGHEAIKNPRRKFVQHNFENSPLNFCRMNLA
jgi:hypothetical protein